MFDDQTVDLEWIARSRVAIYTGCPNDLIVVNDANQLMGDSATVQDNCIESRILHDVFGEPVGIRDLVYAGQAHAPALVPDGIVPIADEALIVTDRAKP